MKKILAFAFMLLVAAEAYAQEGKRIYTKYSDSEGVSAVYISPSMFKIIGKLPEMEVEVGDGETMDIAPLVRSFSGFYLLDIEDNSMALELRTEVNSMIGKGRYEMLMEMKDSGTTVRIYTAGDEKTIESFIFLASEGDEAQFICLEGSMNRKDVEELIAKAVAQ